ncbi:hypothetical protein MVEN_01162700 [Mycena venus]|uniref:Uncharacterized protein n=1 Tax=Mycena venus TaxID=2733690 RepID=A0A8H6Y0X0_9AGAR|nr:hypothetical protein MVEN_01162700 [Mycena venus]
MQCVQRPSRFWDANYGGGEYDTVARRKGAPADPPATLAPIAAPARAATHAAAPPAAHAGVRTPVSRHRSGTPNDAVVQALNGQLRDIEILVQQKMEAPEAAGQDDETSRPSPHSGYRGIVPPTHRVASDQRHSIRTGAARCLLRMLVSSDPRAGCPSPVAIAAHPYARACWGAMHTAARASSSPAHIVPSIRAWCCDLIWTWRGSRAATVQRKCHP